MSAKSFNKKIWCGISTFSVCFVMIFCILAMNLSKLQRVGQAKTFYFLLSTETNVEVGVEFSKLDGGAGYLLQFGDKEYVALSVYESKVDGEKIQTSLRDMGKETTLVKVGGNDVYVHDVRELRQMESYISMLNQCISSLEKGMSQEKCKEILKILQRQCVFSAKGYNETEYAQIFKRVGEELSCLIQKDVYVKDLRYVLCLFVDNYARLSAKLA